MKTTAYFIRLTALLLIGLAVSGCAQQLKQGESVASVAAVEGAIKGTIKGAVPAWVEKPPQGYVVVEITEANGLQSAQNLAIPRARALLQQALLEATAVQIAQDDQRTHLRVGSLEDQVKKTIRSQVAAGLTFNLVRKAEWFDATHARYFGLYAADPKTLKQALTEQLLILDQQLTDYKHATYLGTELDQLLSLAPVLPTLEARQVVKKAWLQAFGDLPKLPNEYLARLMDLQLSGLFTRINISVDSLTAETAAYEPWLVTGLRESGLNISARRPSLMVRYYIEQYIEDDELVLVTDIELNHRDGSRFAHFSDEIVVSFEPEDIDIQAYKTQAYTTLANSLTGLILDKLYTQIRVFNEHHFGR